jgi:hypothetical protein
MDMSKYAGSESKYLKASDLKGKRTKVKIESVSLLEFEDEKTGEKITKPALKLVGKEKELVCNATSVEGLIRAFGDDSDSWIGGEIELSTKYYSKFDKDGIVINPVGSEDFDDDIPF